VLSSQLGCFTKKATFSKYYKLQKVEAFKDKLVRKEDWTLIFKVTVWQKVHDFRPSTI